MAGLSCATELRASGHSVSLFDKGRGPGGRMSTRRLETALGEVSIDHGAQYFTARDQAFRELVATWSGLGVAKPWPLAGADAWVGVPGMSAVIRQMAQSHDVLWNHPIKGLIRRGQSWWLLGELREVGPFDCVLLAIPAEQSAVILSLHDLSMTRVALAARSQPCWAALFVFDEPLDFLPTVIRGTATLAWAARDSAKPGRNGPEAWVVQGSASWSSARLQESPERICELLLGELTAHGRAAIPKPVASQAHLWRYALSAGTGDSGLWNSELRLGACGDWLLGPRVECAWLSGRWLGEKCTELHAVPRAAQP